MVGINVGPTKIGGQGRRNRRLSGEFIENLIEFGERDSIRGGLLIVGLHELLQVTFRGMSRAAAWARSFSRSLAVFSSISMCMVRSRNGIHFIRMTPDCQRKDVRSQGSGGRGQEPGLHANFGEGWRVVT